MVYKRYIKKNGKTIGPYLYKSVRQLDGSVKSIYVGKKPEDSEKRFTLLILGALVLSFLMLFLVFRSSITGYLIFPQPETFSKDINLETSQSMTYDIELDHEFFELTSLSISGSLTGENAKIYLEFDNKSYLISDISKLDYMGLVGYAISEFEAPAEETQPVEETPAETPSEVPVEQPAETPEQPQAEIPVEQPVEVPVEQPVEQLVQETPKEQPAQEQPIEFQERCRDTCTLSEIGIGRTNYKLRIELTNGKLKIDKVTYSIRNLKNALNIDDASLDDLKEKGSAKVIFDMNEEKGFRFLILENNVKNEIDVTHEFKSSNDFAGEIKKDDIKNLIYNSQIKEIQSDFVSQILLSQSVPLMNGTATWGKQVYGINITGLGETVCVIDTGVANHDALAGKIMAQHCYCAVSGPCCSGNSTENSDATDNNGHGTHVAGIIASKDAVYMGMAPDANLIAVKVCDASGYCASSDMIAGIEFCINQSSSYNISAISVSIGGGSYSDSCDSLVSAMTDAINSARQKGIPVVIASGNSGYSDKLTWPACVQNATTTMAMDKSDNVASYSNRNYLVDLAATGGSSSNPITSTILGNSFGGKYGTSMATPHVSGAIALLQQYSQLFNGHTLSPDKIENILRTNGKAIYDSGSGRTFYRVDVLSSVNAILKTNTIENSIEKQGKAKIIFSESTDLSSAEAFSISDNFIGLDSADYPQFNKPANVVFYNLVFEKTPIILKNGNVCINCSVINYSMGTLSFTIQGFSNYTSSVNSQLSIFDSRNNTAWINQLVTIYANYSSIFYSQSITGMCSISINNSITPMSYDGNIYSYNNTFSSLGQYNYNITCNSTDYETLTVQNSLNVSKINSIINLTLNGYAGNLSVLQNTPVLINAGLIQPSEGTLRLYLNNSQINSGYSSVSNSISNTTTIGELGNFSVNAAYEGNENYTSSNITLWIIVITDAQAPQWSNVKGNNEVYGKNKSYQINLTWQDNIALSSVRIEHNLSGSMQNYSVLSNGNEFYYNLNDLSAGIHQFRWYANDSSGNLNSTLMNLTIAKTGNPVQLYINGAQASTSINYGSQSNATAYSEGNAYLFRDNVRVSNPEIATLTAKPAGYLYRANATGNENYTDNATGVSYYLYVPKTDSSLSLYFNNNEGNYTYPYATTLEIKAQLNTPSSGTIAIYKDDSQISSGSSPLTISREFTTGTSKVSAVFSGDSNYAAKNKTFYITVQTQTQSQPQQTQTQSGLSGACTPSWTCSEYSACTLGNKTRICNDINGCETNDGKPIESLDCSCKENLKCTSSGCENGIETVTCVDSNKCSADTVETKNCIALPATPSFGLEKVSGVTMSISDFFNNIGTNAGKIAKTPVFFISLASAILAAFAFIFRRNVFNTLKGLKRYKLKFKFKVGIEKK